MRFYLDIHNNPDVLRMLSYKLECLGWFIADNARPTNPSWFNYHNETPSFFVIDMGQKELSWVNGGGVESDVIDSPQAASDYIDFLGANVDTFKDVSKHISHWDNSAKYDELKKLAETTNIPIMASSQHGKSYLVEQMALKKKLMAETYEEMPTIKKSTSSGDYVNFYQAHYDSIAKNYLAEELDKIIQNSMDEKMKQWVTTMQGFQP